MNEIKKIACHVFKKLGPGYSERVYQNAMEVGLRIAHIPYERERTVNICYNNCVVGSIRADLIVKSDIVVELKSTKCLNDNHRIQLNRYLSDLNCQHGLLINFPSHDATCEIEHIEKEDFSERPYQRGDDPRAICLNLSDPLG